MDDPIHDYASVVNEAERQRRILEDLERSEANKPILTPATKMFLGLTVLVALGAIGWKYARPWMDTTGSDQGGVDTSVSTDTGSGGAVNPTPGPTPTPTGKITAPAIKFNGRMGDEITAGSVIVNVLALNLEQTNRKDIQVAGLLALVGNGGQQAMRAPAASVFLFDSNGRQYSSRVQEGLYRAGAELNPLIKQNARWTFIVPSGIELTRVQFQAADETPVMIDLSKHADSLETQLGDAETATWLDDLDRSITKAVNEQNTLDPERIAAQRLEEQRIAAEKTASESQARTLGAKQDAATRAHQALTDQETKVENLQQQFDAAKKAQSTAEKHARSAADALGKAQNGAANATAAFDAAKREQQDANTALQQLDPDWRWHNPIRVKPMETRLAKANQELERCNVAVQNTRNILDDKQTASTAADTELTKDKGDFQRLSSLVTNESKQLEQLQKQADSADADVTKVQDGSK